MESVQAFLCTLPMLTPSCRGLATAVGEACGSSLSRRTAQLDRLFARAEVGAGAAQRLLVWRRERYGGTEGRCLAELRVEGVCNEGRTSEAVG